VRKGAQLGSRARAKSLPRRALFHSSPRHSSVRPREKRGPSLWAWIPAGVHPRKSGREWSEFAAWSPMSHGD